MAERVIHVGSLFYALVAFLVTARIAIAIKNVDNTLEEDGLIPALFASAICGVFWPITLLVRGLR